MSARDGTSGTTEAEKEIAITGCWLQPSSLVSIIVDSIGAWHIFTW